jgi:hypothetical protein
VVQRYYEGHEPTRVAAPREENGVESEAAARAKLAATYEHFMSTQDPRKKSEVGKEMIQAVFGTDAIAEDPRR